MPKAKTSDEKNRLINEYEQTVKQIHNIKDKWNIRKLNYKGEKVDLDFTNKRALTRKGIDFVKEKLTYVQNIKKCYETRVADITRNNNLENGRSGQYHKIVRKSGLIYESNIPVPKSDEGIMPYRDMLTEQRPDQIIKIKVLKTDDTIEWMNLDYFLDFIEGYEDEYKEVLAISSYSLGLQGGCATKNDAQKISFEINDWKFNCKTVVTKDNDCIFAVLSKSSGIKKTGKVVRRELGFELGSMIRIDELQKLSDYYNIHILLYIPDSETVHQYDIKCQQETEKVSVILLFKSHYFLVEKVIRPELQIRQTKFDKQLENIIVDSSKFEVMNEEEFSDFQDITNFICQSQKHIFITGSGGVGKSYLCNLIQQQYNNENKKILVTSSTGVSAIQIGGKTIHSQLAMNKKQGFKSDVIIDEISMISGDIFIEIVQATNKNKVRLIMFGDLFQLPPVKTDINGGHFFEAINYEDIHNNMVRIDLNKIKRTDNQEFIKIQQKIRKAEYDEEVYNYLRQNQTQNPKPLENELILAFKNDLVNEYNQDYLKQFADAQKLEFQPTQFIDMDMIDKIFKGKENEKNLYLAKISKTLKTDIKSQIFYKGERVMLRTNMIADGLCNGSVGVVLGVDQENSSVTVLFDNGTTKNIQPLRKYKKNIAEVFSEKIPLMCAFAITIHKSQGMTIRSKVLVNLKGVYNNELIYVAISRVIDFSLLRIYSLPELWMLKKVFKPNPTVIDYFNNQFNSSCYKMLVDDEKKQMIISRHTEDDLLDQNSLYFDFETAEKHKNGIICHQPYYNHITYYKDQKLQEQKTFQDYGEDSCDDVALETFKYMMKIINQYEQEYKLTKKTQDKNLISIKKKHHPRIVTFNGGGFDIYFILEKILQEQGYSEKYTLKTTFKGNNLVIFAIWSLEIKSFVLTSFDICQITGGSLSNALKSFCPQIAQKIEFKKEIIYLAKNRYRNPELLNGQHHTITAKQMVRIIDEHNIKFIENGKIQDDNGWKLQENDIQTLKLLQQKPDNFQRCFQFTVHKSINLKQQLDEYAQNDTLVMQPLLKALDDVCVKKMNCSIINFNTAGQLCWYGKKINLPNEILAGKRYDENRNDKTRKKGGEILTNLYKNDMAEEKHCLKSIIGGKTCPRMKKLPIIFDPKSHERIYYVYLDISGMYCDLMLRYEFPYGVKRWLPQQDMLELLKDLQTKIPTIPITQLINIKDRVLELQEKFFSTQFIAEVDIQENPHSIEPVVAYKKKIAGTDEKPIYKTMYSNERRIQTLTSIDILTILMKGGKIHNISKCLIFETSGKILHDWMKKCLEIKNDGKRLGLDALTAFGKLLANGTYGQTLKQDRHDVTLFVNDQWDSDKFLDTHTLKNIFITDSDTDIIIGTQKVNKSDFVTSRCSYIGSFVLAYSRLVIQDICQHLNPEQNPDFQLLYGDTDSLLCREDLVRERLIPKGYIQARSGLLADELADTLNRKFWFPKEEAKYYNNKLQKYTNKDDVDAIPDEKTWQQIIDPSNYKFCRVTEGIFVQPKTIAILYQDPDNPNEWHEKFRAKGIPTSSKYKTTGECLSYKLFVDLYNKAEKNQEIIDEEHKEISRGEELQLPDGLKILTPNLVNGDYNKIGESSKNVKKNSALYKVVPNQMTRKIFNTEYKGRQVFKDDDNIYVPFGYVPLQ